MLILVKLKLQCEKSSLFEVHSGFSPKRGFRSFVHSLEIYLVWVFFKLVVMTQRGWM